MESNQEHIKVAIHCLVYNHEPYLRKCLDGFVMQKTNFRFVAIVHEDASKDGSASILHEYEDKYPEIIHPIYETENQWTKPGSPLSNIMSAAIAETGADYTAICEGDDYWTDPLKLQKQVDILEADHTLMACCTNNAQVDAAGNKIGEVLQFQQGARYTIRDFVEKCPIYPTLTVLYRNVHTDEINQIAKRIQTSFVGDWPRWAAIHLFGDFYVLPDITAAYRINPTSVTHTCNRIARVKTDVQMCLNLADELPASQEDLAAQLRDTRWKWLAYVRACKAERKYLKMFWYLLLTSILTPRSIIKLFRKDA